MKNLIILIGIIFLISVETNAQVQVHPVAVYIDPILRQGEMLVMNPAEEAKEIEISLRYGYPAFDSLGNSFTFYDDSLTAGTYSLAPYLSIFPRKIIIPAKGEQSVRFMLRNAQDLPDGVYWARIVTKSTETVAQVDTTVKDMVSVGIQIKLEMVTAIIMQKGIVYTEIDIPKMVTSSDSANVNLLVEFLRGGNSPAFGSVNLTIKDERGNVIEEKQEFLSLYFSCIKSFQVPKEKLKPGKYTAEVKYTNEQPITPDKYRLNFGPYNASFVFEIN